MTTKQSAATVTDPASGVVRALVRAAGEAAGPAGLSGHFVTAAFVLDALRQNGAGVGADDAAALQDAWVDVTGRLVKNAAPMTPSDRLYVDAMREHGTWAWTALDELTGRAASGDGEGEPT